MKEAGEVLLSVKELADSETDRDKYVYDIYYAHYLGASGSMEEATSLLQASVAFLEYGEIFYEMLARAWLTRFTYQNGQETLAREQLEVFDNPRATYFSMESKVLAAITHAKLTGNQEILENWKVKSKAIGADYLTELMNNEK